MLCSISYGRDEFVDKMMNQCVHHALVLCADVLSSVPYQQRSSTPTWLWKYRMWRAPPSLSGATCPAGSRTSCCESFEIPHYTTTLFRPLSCLYSLRSVFSFSSFGSFFCSTFFCLVSFSVFPSLFLVFKVRSR